MKNILLAVLALTGFGAISQINYEPGYFVTNDGKRTECLVRNVAWKDNPKNIEIKSQENADSRELTISDLAEFGVGTAYKYKRFTIEVDKSSSDANELSVDRNPVFQKETALLRILIESNVTLYQYESGNLVRFFISSGDHSAATQLIYKTYLSGGSSISENNYFRQQLSGALISNNLSADDFRNVEYTKKSLINLFVKYGANANIPFTNLNATAEKSTINFKIVAGGKLATVDINTFGDIYFLDYSDTQIAFMAGVEAELIFPFNQRKWSIFTNPLFESFSSDGMAGEREVEIKYNSIALNFGARHYLFLNDTKKLHFELGYVLSLAQNSYINYKNTYSIPEREIRNGSSLFGGIGFSTNSLTATLRYDFARNLLGNNAIWETKYSGPSLLVSYKIL